MNSTIVDGAVLDWHYTKNKEHLNVHNFYIGRIAVGAIFQVARASWTAVNCYKSGTRQYKVTKPVEGFRSRYYASKYLLDLNGL